MDQVDPADAIKKLVQEGEAAIERGDRPAADLAFGQAFDFAEALLTGPADASMINHVTWDVDHVLGHTLPSLMASGQWEQAARLLRRACRIYKTIGWEAESAAEYQKRMVAIAGLISKTPASPPNAGVPPNSFAACIPTNTAK